MAGKNPLSGNIADFTIYRYVGPGYMMGVPARDLTAADIIEVYEREGITREQIEACGLYERRAWVEVDPFCGEMTESGQRCRRRVRAWGQQCWQHGELEF